jgi:hypothetical protein
MELLFSFRLKLYKNKTKKTTYSIPVKNCKIEQTIILQNVVVHTVQYELYEF